MHGKPGRVPEPIKCSARDEIIIKNEYFQKGETAKLDFHTKRRITDKNQGSRLIREMKI